MRLTDRTTANTVTKQDYIHVVITGDTSQSPEGSSYKARIGQIPELYNLPIPTVRLTTNISGFTTSVTTLNDDNKIGDPIFLINPPIVITDNLTQDQLNNHVFIEMVQYKMKRGRYNNHGSFISKGGGYVIQPRMEDDGIGGVINVLQKRIMSYYNKTITTRGGVQTFNDTNPLGVYRTNHYEVSFINQYTDLSGYFEGRYSYINLNYIDSLGSGNNLNVPVPYTNHKKNTKQKIKSGNLGSPYKLCYFGSMTSLYVAFRYIMFDPEANNGKGQFVEGPLSKTIKVSNKYFPLLHTINNGKCNINPEFTSGGNRKLIKFSFVE